MGVLGRRSRIAILISGRGSNMEAVVEQAHSGILRDRCEVALVVADREGAAGLEVARRLGVATACVSFKGKGRRRFDEELAARLLPLDLDYVVLAGFMRVLTGAFLDRFPGRVINIHPADTALYQGAQGYEWALEQGLDETTITVHFVDEGVDTGPVIARAPVDLRGAGDLEEIKRRGLAAEHRLYSEALLGVLSAGDGGGG